jgi:outer membrane protein assembly factor BamA
MGMGYHFDYYYNVKDKLLNLNATTPLITNYYIYNVNNGFSQTSSLLSGVSIDAVYDTRDNQNNPHKGRYALLSFRYNPVFLGSNNNSSTLYAEYRDYVNFTRDNHNILAFWAIGNFTTSGVLPYWNLPTIGWDQFSKSGEGYVQGRFRGQNLIFGQTEYRRHLFGIKNNPSFMSMVVFANMTTASSKENNIALFKYVDPAFGTGLRVNVSPIARIRVAVDYAIGFYGSMGIYFRLNETF